MVTIAQYRQICAEWNGDPADFSWIIEHGDIAGVSQRAIADEFEFASSTVCRWAAGEALPHKRIRKLVIASLEKKAGRLESAATNAVRLPLKTVGDEEPQGKPQPQS